MRVLVVDDEPLARRRLVSLLRRLAIVTAVDEAEDGPAALTRDADVVLLDISMPGIDGLQVAAELRGRAAVIFTTAHPEHALAAFEREAVDYLLKPVQQARLERALSRVVVRAPAAPLVRITARHRDGVHLFDPADIESFRAVDKLTAFTVGGREHLVDQSLASLEEVLPGFVRVHRGQIVRVDAVVRLARDDEGPFLVLASGETARVSRRQLAEVEARLGVRPG